jgi:ubiquinone/menaquinone biosynthesis C-methylase UbiE
MMGKNSSDPSEHSSLVAFDSDRRAATYDRRWCFYTEVTIRETLRRLDLPQNSTVLDLGCGTGSLMASLVNDWSGLRVVGIDISEEMLRLAVRKIKPENALALADAHGLPFRKESFDLIVCCNSFHFLSCPKSALTEMMRILRPSGRIVITDWCDDYLVCKIRGLYLRWFDPAHFRMYGSRKCGSLLKEVGFDIEMLERFRISWLWGLMTAKARKCK